MERETSRRNFRRNQNSRRVHPFFERKKDQVLGIIWCDTASRNQTTSRQNLLKLLRIPTRRTSTRIRVPWPHGKIQMKSRVITKWSKVKKLILFSWPQIKDLIKRVRNI